MKPQIEFSHVLGELSVNRNDPCEVLRELISNSYDANATQIHYLPMKDVSGLAFWDDGSGLSISKKANDITPWEAFFSIGKSTKKKGDAIGYKCQGSKLCFACSRILVATTENIKNGSWHYKVIENPRSNLDTEFNIAPDSTADITSIIDRFFTTSTSDTSAAIDNLKASLLKSESDSRTLIIIDNLDTENFEKHFAIGEKPEESYAYNYIRLYTSHGDVRQLTKAQGYSPAQVTQLSTNLKKVEFHIFAEKKQIKIPFGYPYLEIPPKIDPNIKSPAEVSRLRDGNFYSRAAKRFKVGTQVFSIALAIDGNRRAHNEYKYLGRKGAAMSGIKLSDHRGAFVSVKGIKICRYHDLLANLAPYDVMVEGDSPSHFSLILDGDFDLVTNRNALSKKAYDTLSDPGFLVEIKKFLDERANADAIFAELLSRLRKESSELKLNEQISNLDQAKSEIKSRERFRIKDANGVQHLFLSPRAGEEYLVGILYSQLANFLPKQPGFEDYWRRIVTFSTQGIDSIGLRNETAAKPLESSNLCSVEYKYEFNNNGPFNHALAVVDYIVAWQIDVDESKKVRDTFTCFGDIAKVSGNDFEWEITNIEDQNAATYSQTIKVICLKSLIAHTFGVKFLKP
ncbi:ATP-binding protein [Herbaspirillum robiniae]|uniref:ATP-binding protein n=1 Tax=Herbaspirillum robiniae TaxID=2014887 RepID=UPI0011E4D532|nr:ATP-binding protein [Herbaspirillum robiniae]